MDINNKHTIYYYSCLYLPNVAQELTNYIEQIKPITLEITVPTIKTEETEGEEPQTFRDFITDNYYYNMSYNIYLSKKYFYNSDYIRKPYNINIDNYKTTYIYDKFVGKSLYTGSLINESRISNMTPILFFSNWTAADPNIDGCVVMLINKTQAYCIYIVNKIGNHTKKAICAK